MRVILTLANRRRLIHEGRAGHNASASVTMRLVAPIIIGAYLRFGNYKWLQFERVKSSSRWLGNP